MREREITSPEAAAQVEEPARSARAAARPYGRLLGWARSNLFNSIPNTIVTILALWLLWETVPPALNWAFVQATWSGADPAVCRDTGGACWALIEQRHRLILFGLYPYDEHWRPLAATALLLGMLAVSAIKTFWSWWLAVAWTIVLPVMAVLMWGGVFGLTFVENSFWGGLPLTLILAITAILFAFPLSILLALGRRSDLPAIKAICIGYIELWRGVPLVSVLFMASVMFPLFMPEGVTVDKLLRALVGLTMFTAAYLAEAVRGGLQAIPQGQYEAADALGLGYWRKTLLVILPQALRISIPPMVNQFISTFKDTSLVTIIGLYDLLTTAKAALADPAWRPFYVESYVFAAAIYFVFCFFMSRYSQYIERDVAVGVRR